MKNVLFIDLPALAERLKGGKPVISPGDGNGCLLLDGKLVAFDQYINCFAGKMGTVPEVIHIPREFLAELKDMEQYDEKTYDGVIKRWFKFALEFKKSIWQ